MDIEKIAAKLSEEDSISDNVEEVDKHLSVLLEEEIIELDVPAGMVSASKV